MPMLPVVTEEKSNRAASSKKQITVVPARRSQRIEAKKLRQTSPTVEKVLRDMKKVDIKLRKIKIDPNLLSVLLEENTDEDRVESVVGKILTTKNESSPVTSRGRQQSRPQLLRL